MITLSIDAVEVRSRIEGRSTTTTTSSSSVVEVEVEVEEGANQSIDCSSFRSSLGVQEE